MREAGNRTTALATARAAFANGDWPAALAASRRAVDADPVSVAALALAVDSALRCDALASAVPWLEALLRLHPGHPLYMHLLASARHELAVRRQQDGADSVARRSPDRMARQPDAGDDAP